MKLRLLFITVLVCQYAAGQELSNIGKSPLFQVNGGLSVNQTFNWSDVPPFAIVYATEWLGEVFTSSGYNRKH